jgi:predicted RNase H-like HicB family nuclease
LTFISEERNAQGGRDILPTIASCYPCPVDLNTYHVQADWDPEAGVWVATSDDVPGLATEAETIESLTSRLRTMIPELLEANGLLPGGIQSDPIAFELTSHRQELVTLAS